MATATDLGKAGLQGWREKVGDAAAKPLSSKTKLEEDHVKAAVGILFFVLSVVYIVAAIKEASEHLRG
jgi:hypothetical protein